MLRKLVICLIVFAAIGQTDVRMASATAPVEVFDLKQDKVSRSVASSVAIEQEAEKLIQTVTGLVTKIDPIPKDGYMVKVPFASPVRVSNEWIKNAVDQVIFVFPIDEDPYLMLINSDDQALFFYFSGEPEFLFKEIHFNPQDKQASATFCGDACCLRVVRL